MKDKIGKELSEEHSKISELEAITFDGKKNHNVAKHCKSNLEENITVISEPNGEYLHHFTPDGTKRKDIGPCLYDVVVEYQSQDTLKAVGADATAANTSFKVGAIRYLELRLGFAVQWIIWQDSHSNFLNMYK